MNKYLNNKDSKSIVKYLSHLQEKNKEYTKPIDNFTLNILFNLLLKIKTSINNVYLNSNNLITREIKDPDFYKDASLIQDFKSINISSRIKKSIYINSKKQIVYTYKNKLAYRVNFISFIDKTDNLYLNYLDMCCRNIFSIIDFLEQYRSKHCSVKILDLYIFLTDFKKELPLEQQSTIGPDNVNTGVTSPCRETTRIFIYRKEEFMKLVIHEVIHAFGIDMPYSLYNIYTNRLDKIFGIESTYNLNETYTELWALIINILFMTAINNDDSMERDKIKGVISEMLQKEIMFSSVQVIKILNFMSLSLFDLQNRSKNKRFREDTHVFAYYIIKYILLYNIKDFIYICQENINFSFHLERENNKTKLEKLIKIIENTFNNKIFITNFNKIEDIFKTDLDISKSTFIRKTLRMTCLELA